MFLREIKQVSVRPTYPPFGGWTDSALQCTLTTPARITVVAGASSGVFPSFL